MESDNYDLNSPQGIGGFDLANILNGNRFSSQKNKSPILTFKLFNIEISNNNEIMKVELGTGDIIRFMKYTNQDRQPCVIFDIVDEINKVIIAKGPKEYITGIGLAEYLFQKNLITQWETPIMTKLIRAFLFGDLDAFSELLKKYKLKVTKDADWYIRNELGLDI